MVPWPRRPVRRWAMKRKLVPPCDAIWLSDDILSNAFQRFCALSKTSRRHGSSVPGPMECRRRLGKRRMAYMTQDAQPPAHFFAALWGLGGNVDRTQWQWEAPILRPHPKAFETRRVLPKWLAICNELLQEPKRADESTSRLPDAPSNDAQVTEMFCQFRRDLEETRPAEIGGIFQRFQEQLSYSLSLGLVSDDLLSSILQETPPQFAGFWERHASFYKMNEMDLTYNELCCRLLLPLYVSIWEGLRDCKVLQPVDRDEVVVIRLFSALAAYSAREEIQVLLQEILQPTSIRRHPMMVSAILNMIRHWSIGLLNDVDVGDSATSMAEAEKATVLSQFLTGECDQKVMDLEENAGSKVRINDALRSISNARLSITTAIRTIKLVEHVHEPWRASSEKLAQVLDLLPNELNFQLAPRLCSLGPLIPDVWGKMRYRMLHTLAKMRCIDDQHLIQAWLKFEEGIPWRSRFPKSRTVTSSLSGLESCDIMLNHWISRGYVKDGVILENHFDASMSGVSTCDFGLLLVSTDVCRENCWERSNRIFDMLIRLGKYEEVVPALKRLLVHGILLHPLSAAVTINKLATHDVPIAWKFYCTFQEHAQWNPRSSYPLTRWTAQKDSMLEVCRTLVLGLVYDTSFSLGILLRALGINETKDASRPMEKREPLRPRKVKLLRKLSMDIAECERRSARTRVRNLQYINGYLRANNIAPHPSITRAFSHVCITESIVRGKWIGTERARWVLSTIKAVEGPAVADAVAEGISSWQQHMLAENAKDDFRERAPLDMRGQI